VRERMRSFGRDYRDYRDYSDCSYLSEIRKTPQILRMKHHVARHRFLFYEKSRQSRHSRPLP